MSHERKKMKNITYVAGRRSPYCVSVISGGVRKRKFFEREADAKAWLRARKQAVLEHGINAMFFSQAERNDYEESLKVAKSYGFDSVLRFVLSFKNGALPGGTLAQEIPSMSVALKQFLAEKSKVGRSESTIADIRSRVGSFISAYQKKRFPEITRDDLENWCVRKELSAQTAKNNFVVVSSFLRWAKKRRWVREDLDLSDKAFLPRILKKQKTVFSLDETKRILSTILGNPEFRRYAPHFAIQFFCGVRSAEASRMRWNMIDFDRREIRLPAEITKTGEEHVMRAPFLPETVFAWLEPFRPTVVTDGKIKVPERHAWSKIVSAVGGWEHNGMRHTFATMHVSLHGDTAKTALLLRHRNQQRLWSNYLARLVPEAEARAYFALTPDNVND